MRRQSASIAARRFRQSVTLGRVAIWSSFGAAVLSQGALLAGGYFLIDETSPNAPRNAALAGCLALAGLVVAILARWAGSSVQSRTTALGRVQLRLVPEAEPSQIDQHRRPAS